MKKFGLCLISARKSVDRRSQPSGRPLIDRRVDQMVDSLGRPRHIFNIFPYFLKWSTIEKTWVDTMVDNKRSSKFLLNMVDTMQ